MKESEIEIVNERGFHARAASKFVNLACNFHSAITINKDSVTVDGKSILGILLLQAARGSSIVLRVDGQDEEEAFDKLSEMIKERFGEAR